MAPERKKEEINKKEKSPRVFNTQRERDERLNWLNRTTRRSERSMKFRKRRKEGEREKTDLWFDLRRDVDPP